MSGKLFAVGDFEACIKDLQRRTDCGPEHTCIFGRSAGGLLIGNLLSKYPTGELFHCVYAEAPYVDLLKTASNPALPLTEYEYKEFANPRKGPAEFEQALRISPIHSLPAGGAPGVHVLCRSGKNDIQVYPYEALKWILTLRGNREDTSKILHVNSQYHSTYGAEMYLEYAEDFLIINNWLK
jgi:protease II